MDTRRGFLTAVAAATAAAGGCAGALGENASTGDPGTGADAEGVRIDELSVQNADDGDHRVQVAVDAGGEMLHLGTYDLEAGTTRSIAGEWGESTAPYRVHARLDDGEIRTADATAGVADGTSCVRVLLRIEADGSLTVWNGANCATDDTPTPG